MYHIPAALARSAGAAVANLVRDPAGVIVTAFQQERARAFLAAPVLMGLGIAFYFLVRVEPPLWAAPLALAFSGFCFWSLRRTGLRALCTVVCLAATGLCLISLRVALVDAPILPAEVGPAEMTGTVTRIERRPDATRLTIRPDSFGRLRSTDLPELVKLSARAIDGPVSPGARVRLLASAQPPSSPAEPGAFDFQRHAYFQGIGGYGFAMGPVTVLSAPATEGGFSRFRDQLSTRIAETVGTPHGGVAAALVTGDRSRVTEEQWRVLRDSGLAHLLAISGLHMGLVTGFLFFGVRAALALFPSVALRRPIKKWAALAALAGGLGYLVLTGGSVTTIRAFVMVAIVMLAVGAAVAELPGAVRLVPAMPVWGLASISLGGLWLCILTRNWRFWGLLGIAAGLLSPYLTERPLLRVDADARLVSVRTSDGGTMLSSNRREKFTAEQWLARDAASAAAPWPASGASRDGRLRCDSAGCILRVDGWMIALPGSPAALAEDCRRADLVISLEPVEGRCPSARVVIDRFDIWRDGAHAVWLDPGKGPRVRSTGRDRGARPWNPAPVPRKDQYWRKRAVSRP